MYFCIGLTMTNSPNNQPTLDGLVTANIVIQATDINLFPMYYWNMLSATNLRMRVEQISKCRICVLCGGHWTKSGIITV
jgi:hypothetical protein